jgi:hypothetical protein
VIAGVLALSLLLQGLAQNPQGYVQGAIGGKLLTADGVPAVAVRVVAIKVPDVGDLSPDYSQNYFALSDPSDRTLTDNEGNFQLREIVPGRYYLLAGASPYGTFYPGEGNIRGAAILDIRAGTEVLDYNFKLVHRLGGKLSGRINADPSLMRSRLATATGGPLEDLLEVPIKPDGSFEFGHLPPGKYLVSLFPPTPGIAAFPVTVAEADVSGVELVPLPTNTITGRIISRNGPIPHGILGFYTERTYVGGKIHDDGTFSVELHSARHQIDFAGLPVGYSLASVRMGGQDMTQQGIVVNKADVSDVVITVNAPTKLASIRGKVTGLPQEKFNSTILELTGPTFTTLHADVQQDATFEFPVVVPGLYKLSLKGIGADAQLPEMAPLTVVVDSFRTVDVLINVPSR